MATLTIADVNELQFSILDAILATNDNARKKKLRAEMQFYQVEKARIISANNQKRIALLSPRIARLEQIIAELGDPSLLIPIKTFKVKAGLPAEAPPQPEQPATKPPVQPPVEPPVAPAEETEIAEAETVEERFGLTSEILTQIQETLKERGIYDGPVNGKLDDDTRAAVRGFQRMNGLNDDGIPGKKTQNKLWPEPIVERVEPLPAPVVVAAANQWPTEAGVQQFYGTRGQNQAMLQLPFSMRLAWDRRKTVRRMSCHEKIHDALERIFKNTLAEYGEQKITDLGLNIFSGCLNVRKKVGGNSWSMHSWGIAVDIDNERNQLKWNHTRAELAKPVYEPFWKIVEAEGALSLGRVKDFDWMHFQFARL